jgi:hypothetical protein
MGTRTKILATLAVASAWALLALPTMASAARSGVTIHRRSSTPVSRGTTSPPAAGSGSTSSRTVDLWERVCEIQQNGSDSPSPK